MPAFIVDDGVFASQQLHAGLPVKALGQVFRAGINFVVAVAAIDAERGAQLAHFFDAVPHGVVHAGDQVPGDDGQVGADVIGHVHGAANRFAGHVRAQMNVADLDDLHAVKLRRQVVQRDFDAAQFVAQALGRKAVHHAQKRRGAGHDAGGAEKGAARRIGNDVFEIDAVRRKLGGVLRHRLMEAVPEPLDTMDEFDGQISKKSAYEPQASKGGNRGMIGQEPPMILADVIGEGDDDQQPARNVKQADADAQGGAAPVSSDAP